MKINTNNVTLEMSAGMKKQFPHNGLPQIIFSGRSNVGKSSLINSLLGRTKLARVSSAPGKTITVNFYNIDGKMYYVDLPGYGFARRDPSDKEKWSALVSDYFDEAVSKINDRKAMVLQLVDLKVGATPDDDMMLDWLNYMGVPYIIVATKSDKLNVSGKKQAMEKLRQKNNIADGIKIVPFSSLRGEGKDELASEIYRFI